MDWRMIIDRAVAALVRQAPHSAFDQQEMQGIAGVPAVLEFYRRSLESPCQTKAPG
jgi:hypothetical protein